MVARALRDAGMEVVYTGLHQTPEQIVETAVQEDADAVGLSVLSGAHMTLFARLAELLPERGADDVVVFGGGIIPEEDIPELERLGVARIFTPGATTTEIVDWVRAARRGPGRDLTPPRPRRRDQFAPVVGAGGAPCELPHQPPPFPTPDAARSSRAGYGAFSWISSSTRPVTSWPRTRCPCCRGVWPRRPSRPSRSRARSPRPSSSMRRRKVGGRGKAGGVKLADGPDEAKARAEDRQSYCARQHFCEHNCFRL